MILVCWWVALKFEEYDWSHSLQTLAGCIGETVDMRLMVHLEAALLYRISFCIPRLTLTRQLFESMSVHNEVTVTWLFVLLYFDLLVDAADIAGWARLIEDHRDGRLAPLILQSLLCVLPERWVPFLQWGVEAHRLTVAARLAVTVRGKRHRDVCF